MAVVRAELRRMVTLPGTWMTGVATLALALLVGTVLARRSTSTSTGMPGGAPASTLTSASAGVSTSDTASTVAAGAEVLLTVPGYLSLGMIVLGVLAATSERQGGENRTLLTAVPRRGGLLAARYVVLVLLALGVAVASMGGAAVAAHVATGAGPWDWLVLLRCAAHLVVVSVVSFPLGLLTRSTTWALAWALVLLVVAPAALTSVVSWSQWLPSRLSEELLLTTVPGGPAEPAATVAALVAWVVALGCAGASRFCLGDG